MGPWAVMGVRSCNFFLYFEKNELEINYSRRKLHVIFTTKLDGTISFCVTCIF